MANREYPEILPDKPRVQVEPKKILSSFGLQALKTKFYGIRDESGENRELEVAAFSQFGTAVFSNIDFIEGGYTNLKGEEIEYDSLTVNTVLFTVNQSKNIVKTPIQGRNGTVKEYISDGDFDIQIRGIIADPNPDAYPEKEVNKLIEILKVQDNIEIAAQYLNDNFGITNIVIESYALPQNEGFQNMQAFEINAVSDDPIELAITTR